MPNYKYKPLDESKQFYTINDLVKAGYGSRTTIYRDRVAGKLPYLETPSGRILIPRDKFVVYLHDLESKSSSGKN